MSDEALKVDMLVTWCGQEYRLTKYESDGDNWHCITTGRGGAKKGIRGMFSPWALKNHDFKIVPPSEYPRSTSSPPAPVDPVEAVRATKCPVHKYALCGVSSHGPLFCAARIAAAAHHTATSEPRKETPGV